MVMSSRRNSSKETTHLGKITMFDLQENYVIQYTVFQLDMLADAIGQSRKYII